MADILTNNAPALSATSDMPSAAPVQTQAPAPELDTTAAPVAAESTVATTEPAVATPTPVAPTATSKEPIGVRISELTRQRREADERALRLENLANQQSERLAQALEVISKLGSATPQTTSATTSTDISSRPTRDQFADAEAYEEALVTWASSEAASRATAEFQRQQAEAEALKVERENQTKLEQEAQTRRETEQKQADELRNSWESKREAALAKYEDFAEVAESPTVQISDAMALVIMNSDDGAEIAYYLGKHPDEAAKIASMIIPGQVYPTGTAKAGMPMPDPIKQSVAMGRLAAKLGLEATPVVTTEPVTNSLAVPLTTPATTIPVTPAPTVVLAPAPPNPISGSNANATSRSLQEVGNEGTMEEYAARRTPQIIADRRPGGRAIH